MGANKKATINGIFQLYAKKDAKLTLRKLDKNTILAEGDSTALEFQGELILVFVRSGEHSVEMSPKGAGKNRFTKKSTLGLYLHKLPCPDAKSSRKRGASKKVRPTR